MSQVDWLMGRHYWLCSVTASTDVTLFFGDDTLAQVLYAMAPSVLKDGFLGYENYHEPQRMEIEGLEWGEG